MRIKHQRFSDKDKLRIRKLTEEGKSLTYISKLFGTGKPTIYYQVRKFKPRIKKDFVVNLNDFQIGELVGAFAGDGCYQHKNYDKAQPKNSCKHNIRYFLTYKKEKDYGCYIISLLTKLNLNPFTYEKDESVLVIVVNSKEFIELIKEYLIWEEDKTFTIRLKSDIKNYSDDFLRGFARGLMDTDGFMNPGNVACACISKSLIDNLDDIFRRFGLETTRTILKRYGNHRSLYFVRVRRKSLSDYQRIIGFSNLHKRDSLNKILSADVLAKC